MSRSMSHDYTFPIQWLELTESLVRAKQGDIAQIYSRCHVSPDILQHADALLNLDQFSELIQIIQEHLSVGEPRVIQILRHVPVTVHVMGMAAMTADTLGEAVNVGLRYFPLVLSGFELHRENIGDKTHIHIRRYHDFGSPHNEILTELIAGSYSKIAFFTRGSWISEAGIGRTGMEVHFAHSSTEDIETFRSVLGIAAQFGCAENQLIITRDILDQPLLTRNRTSHLTLDAMLAQRLKYALQQQSVTLQVRRLISELLSQGKLPDAVEIARLVTMSTRTLSRRLNAEGSNLNALIKEARIELAELLLISSNLPLSKIAQKLGYSETSVFSRAFKRVKGKAPSELRGHYVESSEH
ncbi:AraC family transcriptional regulator ligand-binding domain-containing protein [Aquirhabdus sp.]|uniref:AraC family transcriptional regulator n=1 Tax=Aquirhabdus sp. TaxID=2824160 RepID=UPI00396C4D67